MEGLVYLEYHQTLTRLTEGYTLHQQMLKECLGWPYLGSHLHKQNHRSVYMDLQSLLPPA